MPSGTGTYGSQVGRPTKGSVRQDASTQLKKQELTKQALNKPALKKQGLTKQTLKKPVLKKQELKSKALMQKMGARWDTMSKQQKDMYTAKRSANTK